MDLPKKDPMKVLEDVIRRNDYVLRKLNGGSKKIRV